MGQNVFDSLHTAQFANFLFMSGNFRLAAEEYERLIFTSNASNDLKLKLIRSYRLNNQPGFAHQRMMSFWPEPWNVDEHLAKEYFALGILNGSFEDVTGKIRQNNFLKPADAMFYEASILLLNEQYKQAKTMIEQIGANQTPALLSYKNISTEAIEMKLKSPWLSGILSALVPGTGKIYTGDWQDGLIAMALIGTSAWQSYRGFSKDGIKSPFGWLMGTVSAGFYAGNIYGSVKSANKYNNQKKTAIKLRVQAIFITNL